MSFRTLVLWHIHAKIDALSARRRSPQDILLHWNAATRLGVQLRGWTNCPTSQQDPQKLISLLRTSGSLCNMLANISRIVLGDLKQWRIFDEWSLVNWQVGESLANGFRRTDTFANLWRMVFGKVTRWRIFGEWSFVNWHVVEFMANYLWRTDALANLWRIFLAKLTHWRIFGEWSLVKWHVVQFLANYFWRNDAFAKLWRIFLGGLTHGF